MYVDTSVFMYAFGSPSPFEESCAAVLDAGAAGRLSLVTSVETLQEILHRYRSLRRTEDLRIVFDAVLASTRAVLPIVSMLAGIQAAALLIAAKRVDQIASEIAVHTEVTADEIKALLQQNTELTQAIGALTKEVHAKVMGS